MRSTIPRDSTLNSRDSAARPISVFTRWTQRTTPTPSSSAHAPLGAVSATSPAPTTTGGTHITPALYSVVTVIQALRTASNGITSMELPLPGFSATRTSSRISAGLTSSNSARPGDRTEPAPCLLTRLSPMSASSAQGRVQCLGLGSATRATSVWSLSESLTEA